MQKSATLITGANGEMGHELITVLHEKNHDNIIALDLNDLDSSIASYCSETIIGNILDSSLMNKLNNEYKFDTITSISY